MSRLPAKNAEMELREGLSLKSGLVIPIQFEFFKASV